MQEEKWISPSFQAKFYSYHSVSFIFFVIKKNNLERGPHNELFDNKAEIEAAIKIQASYRGFTTRKKLNLKNKHLTALTE